MRSSITASNKPRAAVNNGTTVPTDDGATLGVGGITANKSQYLPTTGNMVNAHTDINGNYVPVPVNIMNPYLTVNYIIFSGKY